MANQLAVRAIRWTPDGGSAFDCQRADLAIHLDLVLGLREQPRVRGKDTIVPSLAGRIRRGRIRDVRELELAGLVQGVGEPEATRMSNFDTNSRALADAFAPDVEGTLEVDLRNGTTLSIVALPLPPIVWGQEAIPGVAEVSIALESVTPDWEVV